MPALAVIPEVGDSHYNPYARQGHRRKLNSRPQSAKARTSNTHSSSNVVETTQKKPTPRNSAPKKRDPKPDYYGLSNSMMRLTVTKGPRRWRPKDSSNEPKYAWQTSPRYKERQREREQVDDDGDEDDKSSVLSLDSHLLRKSTYSKFRYPQKYHYGFRTQQSHLENNIPKCLRQYPGYCNQALRQDCQYNPHRSVTHLNVHSVKSGTLPHRSPDGSTVKRRRPTSAPPRTMTSHSKRGSSGSLSSGFRSKSSNASKTGEDLERNGSYQYVYEEDEFEEEEGPTHVTLEVQDSDDDDERTSEHDEPRPSTSMDVRSRSYASSRSESLDAESVAEESNARDFYPTTSELKFDPNSDNVDSEELEIRDDTRQYARTGIVTSDTEGAGYANDTFSVADSDSAQSVDYEPDFS